MSSFAITSQCQNPAQARLSIGIRSSSEIGLIFLRSFLESANRRRPCPAGYGIAAALTRPNQPFN
jgi:hypothetical protein